MSLSAKKLSVIHVARRQLALTDDDYRAILHGIAGVESSTELDDASFEALMFRFRQLGFQSTWNHRNFGYRAGMASPRQVATIRELWKVFTDGTGTDASLNKWIEHKFKVAALRFLTAEAANKAVGGLKIMVTRKQAKGARHAQA